MTAAPRRYAVLATPARRLSRYGDLPLSLPQLQQFLETQPQRPTARETGARRLARQRRSPAESGSSAVFAAFAGWPFAPIGNTLLLLLLFQWTW